jgi:hypothetical protein
MADTVTCEAEILYGNKSTSEKFKIATWRQRKNFLAARFIAKTNEPLKMGA